jgi:hypothetical protein
MAGRLPALFLRGMLHSCVTFLFYALSIKLLLWVSPGVRVCACAHVRMCACAHVRVQVRVQGCVGLCIYLCLCWDVFDRCIRRYPPPAITKRSVLVMVEA